MPLSNLPPGVSGSNPNIDPGCDPWEQVHETIDKDCEAQSMTDCDCFVAWQLGLEAWKAARKLGAHFPHDSGCPKCNRSMPACDCDPVDRKTGKAW